MSATRIRTSVILSGFSHFYGDDLAALIETARIADDCGIDQLVMTDHLAIGANTAAYPYGRFPYPPEEPWLEPLTTLGAIAGATSRVRLGTGIVIVPLRPALLMAKTLATLDVLSGGRVDLGVGTGWQREEFEGAGVPFEGRGARMDDTLRACRALWTDAPASYSSDTVSFQNLWCLPQPVQSGGIPIWLGVRLTPRNIERVVEFGAGWMPLLGSEEELLDGMRTLTEAFVRAGRDPETLGVRGTAPAIRREDRTIDWDRSLAELPRLESLGITVASFALAQFARDREQIRPFLEALGRASG